jgi:hypothetical protein
MNSLAVPSDFRAYYTACIRLITRAMDAANASLTDHLDVESAH